jgi:hypothetical protein
MTRTTFGRSIYGIGNRERAAYLSGINTRRVVMIVFAISGGLAAFGGVLLAGYASKAAQSMGDAYLLPAIAASVRAGELVTFLLLTLPPGLAVLLTGPVPARYAPALTRGLLVTAALLAPFVLGTIFLRAPVLPGVAIELDVDPAARAAPTVLLGRVITVDDRMTTLLDDAGTVHFIPNDDVRSQTLCPDLARVPYSVVRVHGWHAEETALEWMMPRRHPAEPDPRCDGRPLPPPESGRNPTPGPPADGVGQPSPHVRPS